MAEPADKGANTPETERQSKQTAPKGRPTPSRKTAQAANARPLVPGKMDKEALRQAKLADREAREKARVGAMLGEEKYLPARDQGPQRKMVRDFVDGRFNIGEWMIPIMVAVLLLTLVPNDNLKLIFLTGIWGFVAISVFDAWLCGKKAYRLVGEKFGADRIQSGTKMYAAMRALQMRMLRMPKPQVKRGHKVQ